MSFEQQHPIEDDNDSQSDGWEPGEADDAETVYPWERFDDQGRPLALAQQQQNDVTLPPISKPSSADEASLLLAQFRPRKRTPEDLKLLLEARANPDIVIPTETWGKIPPLQNILIAKSEHVPIFSTLGPHPQGYLLAPGPWCVPDMLSSYVHTYSVEEMRELLLEYGATNTREMQQDWRIHKAAIENDAAWLKKFHEDPRVSY